MQSNEAHKHTPTWLRAQKRTVGVPQVCGSVKGSVFIREVFITPQAGEEIRASFFLILLLVEGLWWCMQANWPIHGPGFQERTGTVPGVLK